MLIIITKIANKIDLQPRQVPKEDGYAQAKRWGCTYFETTSENPQKISESFESLITEIQRVHLHAAPVLDTMADLNRIGHLGKEGNKLRSLNRRYFELKDGVLSYANDVGQPVKVFQRQLRCDCYIDGVAQGSMWLLENTTAEIVVDEKKKEGFSFVVTSGDEKYNLTANTEAEREVWMASIKANISLAEVAYAFFFLFLHYILFLLYHPGM